MAFIVEHLSNNLINIWQWNLNRYDNYYRKVLITLEHVDNSWELPH